jgi:SPP1 gp7 family putative phage head morphogenesis protein
MARQIAALRARVGKAARSQEEQDALDQIVAGVDFTGWAVLVGDIDEAMAAIVEDSGYEALKSVGIDVKAEAGKSGIVNQRSVYYADARAAELVGMRYNELGDLVVNPRAEWAITESTRDYLRGSVGDAISEGWSNDKLASVISDSYGFSKDRAMMIARTETSKASNKGAVIGYAASGLVSLKQWLTAEDDLVEEECLENAAAGDIALDADFPSGDDAPPAHPNCRCVIAPVVTLPGEETTTAAEAETADTAAGAAAAPVRGNPMVNRVGTTSDAFLATTNAVLDSFPDGVMAVLEDKDVTFNFGERVTQIRPDLRGVHPRGWPAGTTWDSAEGLFSNNTGSVVVAETWRPIGSKAFSDSKRVAGALRHETGHAFDYALDKASASSEFRDAYRADKSAINKAAKDDPALKSRLKYFLQKGDAGPSEAFAEVFGDIHGGGASPWLKVIDYFPNVAAVIRKLIEEAGSA